MRFPNILVKMFLRIELFTALCLTLGSCGNAISNYSSVNDSLPSGVSEAEFKQHFIDSAKKAMSEKTVQESIAKADSAPVKITNSFVLNNTVGTPEATLIVKNTSKKIIDGVKVGIYCYNNFDEPVNGGITDNEYGGISQDMLLPGKKDSYTWTMSLFGNTTKIKPYIREVHFTDGTTWKSNP